MNESIRIMPCTNPLPQWDENSYSEYPDTLRMAFRNGQIRTYRLEVKQPAPVTYSTGEYIGKHAKKTGDAATSTGPIAN